MHTTVISIRACPSDAEETSPLSSHCFANSSKALVSDAGGISPPTCHSDAGGISPLFCHSYAEETSPPSINSNKEKPHHHLVIPTQEESHNYNTIIPLWNSEFLFRIL